MPLAPGARVGPYEIVTQVGVGGMGEVYRATDTGLNRDVAIKVLPDEFAQDAERLARFEREAKTLASLNHPGIAIIHGFERTDSSRALVMEFVEGPTLAERIAEGPLPVDEALGIAKQIAEALAAAHEQGIVHRDLKPANIKLRVDGTVKVLDFGLAKTIEPAGISTGKSMSPTITSPAMTQAGVILGTAAYMAPEQAKGRGADKRSDTWAFGCVLFEMLTGRRTFDGEDVSDTLALVLRGEPDWKALPPDTPPPIVTLLKRSLEKERRRRLADIGAALFVLDEHRTFAAAIHGGVRSSRRRMMSLAATLAAAVALTATGWWLGFRGRVIEPRLVTRLLIPLRTDELLNPATNAIALSPDGRHLAYNANGQLYLRALDRLDAVVVRGSESVVANAGSTGRPSFSPDSRWLAFVKEGEIRKVSVSGGPPVTIARLPNAGAFEWAPDGSLVVAVRRRIIRIREGTDAAETLVDEVPGFIQSVQYLPQHRLVLFTLIPGGTISPLQSEIIIRSLDTGREQSVVRGGVEARYVSTGHLVYFANGSLLATRFDPRTLTTDGTAAPVVDAVAFARVPGIAVSAAHFAVSPGGTMAYATGDFTASNLRSLVLVDRLGKEEPMGFPDESYVYPRLSPDGRLVAITIRDSVSGDIWILDVNRKTKRPITTGPEDERYTTWAPDGKRIAYGSTTRGVEATTWLQAADGSGVPQRLAGFSVRRFGNFVPTSASSDGTFFVVSATGGPTGSDIWVLPASGNREPTPLLETAAAERNGEISPNGRWLAYESVEDGQPNIVVRPFPNVNEGRYRISTGGGSQPAWSRDGKELFFLDASNLLNSVSVENGAAFDAVGQKRVLSTEYVWSLPTYAGRQYDVSPDGKRFLMMKDAGSKKDAPQRAITIVQNWFEELRSR